MRWPRGGWHWSLHYQAPRSGRSLLRGDGPRGLVLRWSAALARLVDGALGGRSRRPGQVSGRAPSFAAATAHPPIFAGARCPPTLHGLAEAFIEYSPPNVFALRRRAWGELGAQLEVRADGTRVVHRAAPYAEWRGSGGRSAPSGPGLPAAVFSSCCLGCAPDRSSSVNRVSPAGVATSVVSGNQPSAAPMASSGQGSRAIAASNGSSSPGVGPVCLVPRFRCSNRPSGRRQRPIAHKALDASVIG